MNKVPLNKGEIVIDRRGIWQGEYKVLDTRGEDGLEEVKIQFDDAAAVLAASSQGPGEEAQKKSTAERLRDWYKRKKNGEQEVINYLWVPRSILMSKYLGWASG